MMDVFIDVLAGVTASGDPAAVESRGNGLSDINDDRTGSSGLMFTTGSRPLRRAGRALCPALC